MPARQLEIFAGWFLPLQESGHRTEIRKGRKDKTCVRWGQGRGQNGQDRGWSLPGPELSPGEEREVQRLSVELSGSWC